MARSYRWGPRDSLARRHKLSTKSKRFTRYKNLQELYLNSLRAQCKSQNIPFPSDSSEIEISMIELDWNLVNYHKTHFQKIMESPYLDDFYEFFEDNDY